MRCLVTLPNLDGVIVQTIFFLASLLMLNCLFLVEARSIEKYGSGAFLQHSFRDMREEPTLRQILICLLQLHMD